MIAVAEQVKNETRKCSMPMCCNEAVEYWVEDEFGSPIYLNTDMCPHCVEVLLGRSGS